MKTARFVLKFVALGLVIGAAACAVIAYWDRISECVYSIADRIEEKRAVSRCAECDDYDDWETC